MTRRVINCLADNTVGAAARPPIADAEADNRRGRKGPLPEVGQVEKSSSSLCGNRPNIGRFDRPMEALKRQRFEWLQLGDRLDRGPDFAVDQNLAVLGLVAQTRG